MVCHLVLLLSVLDLVVVVCLVVVVPVVLTWLSRVCERGSVSLGTV